MHFLKIRQVGNNKNYSLKLTEKLWEHNINWTCGKMAKNKAVVRNKQMGKETHGKTTPERKH